MLYECGMKVGPGEFLALLDDSSERKTRAMTLSFSQKTGTVIRKATGKVRPWEKIRS